MKELSKEEFKNNIFDQEKIYLISIEGDKVYLQADIEFGGDIGLRIDIMDFDLDTSLGFWNASGECCGRYCGGMTFIEYDSYEEASERILDDFLNLHNSSVYWDREPMYLYCEDYELDCITKAYTDKSLIYITTK